MFTYYTKKKDKIKWKNKKDVSLSVCQLVVLDTAECLIFSRTLLREFCEAPWIRQNKTGQI